MRVTILGCGNSTGVPALGCDCSVCRSDNPKNKRTRVSVLVEAGGYNILIDSSPDLRQQALRHKVRRVDAVLYTHDHADHANGIDDLRSFNYLSGKALPAYGNAATLDVLKQRFPYAFLPPPPIWSRPCLIPHALPQLPASEFKFNDLTIGYFEQLHAKVNTIGYRIGNFAYSTDVKIIPEASFKALEGVEVWIVDCLRYKEAFSHSHLAQTLEWIGRVKPRLAILTHMDHDFDYDKLSKELPSGVLVGFDGMVTEL
jgi:phosphoribosyl 1,2-cyclic phosphate phosphodiesterase